MRTQRRGLTTPLCSSVTADKTEAKRESCVFFFSFLFFLPGRDASKQTRVASFSATFLRHSPVVLRVVPPAPLSSKGNPDHFLRQFIYFSRGEINRLESLRPGQRLVFFSPFQMAVMVMMTVSYLERGLKRSAGCMNGNAAETLESRDQ